MWRKFSPRINIQTIQYIKRTKSCSCLERYDSADVFIPPIDRFCARYMYTDFNFWYANKIK